jgi:hypothetical protein
MFDNGFHGGAHAYPHMMSIKVLDVVICQAIEPQIFVTTHPRSALQIQELVYSTNACISS